MKKFFRKTIIRNIIRYKEKKRMDPQDSMNGLISESLKRIIPQGSEILLFGSRARGDNRADSDWDILILLERKGKSTWEDYDTIGYSVNTLFWNLNQDVNTIIQTKSEWQAKSFTPFYKSVMEDAVAL